MADTFSGAVGFGWPNLGRWMNAVPVGDKKPVIGIC